MRLGTQLQPSYLVPGINVPNLLAEYHYHLTGHHYLLAQHDNLLAEHHIILVKHPFGDDTMPHEC